MQQPSEFPTVAEYAKEYDVKPWRVRAAIETGHLTVGGGRPMRIIAGSLPLSAEDFFREIEPILKKARKGTVGQAPDGSIHILRNGEILEVAFTSYEDRLPDAIKSLEAILS